MGTARRRSRHALRTEGADPRRRDWHPRRRVAVQRSCVRARSHRRPHEARRGPEERVMSAVWFVARAEMRRRWPGVVVLALLVGVSGGAVLAAVAGARRTSTALTRFEAESRTATFEFEAGDVSAEELRALRAAPHVEGVGVLWQMSIVSLDAGFLPAAAPIDSSFGRDVDRARLVEGRIARNADEINIGE